MKLSGYARKIANPASSILNSCQNGYADISWRGLNGSVLKDFREKQGRTAKWVAARAGYNAPHYSKIESKESITVEEYVNVMRALDLRPGDYLENSMDEVKPLLPLVEELKRFEPTAHERVREMLRAAALMLEENLIAHRLRDVNHKTANAGMPYHPSPTNSTKDDVVDVEPLNHAPAESRHEPDPRREGRQQSKRR